MDTIPLNLSANYTPAANGWEATVGIFANTAWIATLLVPDTALLDETATDEQIVYETVAAAIEKALR
jgi:hypothetical protein